MGDNKRKPDIRFQGFTDDWEQRKFVSVFEGLQNNTLSRADLNYENGTVKNVHYGDVLIKFGDYIDASETDLPYISDDAKADKFKNSFLQDGDIIIADTAEDDTVGKCTEIQGSEGLKLSSGLHTIACRPKEKYGPMFLGYYINSPAYHNQLKPLMQGIKVTSISKSALQDTDMIMPKSIEEQTMIGEYYADLDSLITLQQRKYDKLVNVKKSMLEKMFPREGAKVPEIRFEGFTDDWEQRKLGEILQERNNRTSDFENYPLYSLTIENGVTPKTERYERSSLVTKTDDLFKIVQPNEFVTNPMNLRFGALGYNSNALAVSVSGYYDVFSIDEDKCSGFWNSYFKTPTAMKIFDNAATGSLIEKRRVKYSTLQQLDFYMPQDIEEKILLGRYMDNINNLITLQQRKLEKLKNIKKSMLEKMFV